MNQGGGNQTFVIYHNAETQMLRLETFGAGKKDSDEFLTLQKVALKKGLLLALLEGICTNLIQKYNVYNSSRSSLF